MFNYSKRKFILFIILKIIIFICVIIISNNTFNNRSENIIVNGTWTCTSTLITGRQITNGIWTGSGTQTTCNGNSGNVNFNAFSINSLSSIQFTINNNIVKSYSIVLLTQNYPTAVILNMWLSTTNNGNFTVIVANGGASIFTHPYSINFLIV